MCENLIFDKTRSLSGYPIKIVEAEFGYDPTIKGPFNFDNPGIKKLMESIWKPLNPTVITSIDTANEFTYDNKEKKFGSSLFKIMNGTFDTRAFFDYERNFWRNELNLFVRSGTCYATAIERISLEEYLAQIFIFDYLIISMSVVFTIEKLILHFFKLNSADIFMNVIRTFIGATVTWNPKNSWKRFILLLIVFPFMVISNYMQDEFSSFITAPPIKEVSTDRLEDVLQRYELYSTNYHRQYFSSTEYYDQIHSTKSINECYDSLLNNSKKACAADCSRMRYYFGENDLYGKVKISPDINLQKYFAYVYPIDYPLMPRIRDVYKKLYEAGLISQIFSENRVKKRSTEEDELNSISLDEIGLITKLFKMGCVFGVIFFLIEFTISKIISRFEKFKKLNDVVTNYFRNVKRKIRFFLRSEEYFAREKKTRGHKIQVLSRKN